MKVRKRDITASTNSQYICTVHDYAYEEKDLQVGMVLELFRLDNMGSHDPNSTWICIDYLKFMDLYGKIHDAPTIGAYYIHNVYEHMYDYIHNNVYDTFDSPDVETQKAEIRKFGRKLR